MSLSNVYELSQRDEDSFIKGVKVCIPTLLGYLSIGIAAGVIQKLRDLA